MTTKLTAQSVEAIVLASLYKPEEINNGAVPDDAVIVDGLRRKFGFHPERIATAAPQIADLLGQLPDHFHKSKGGGWSFLNGCVDRGDNQWGEQSDVEALVCLGIATKQASWVMREMAHVLPGGVPYFVVSPHDIAKVA